MPLTFNIVPKTLKRRKRQRGKKKDPFKYQYVYTLNPWSFIFLMKTLDMTHYHILLKLGVLSASVGWKTHFHKTIEIIPSM